MKFYFTKKQISLIASALQIYKYFLYNQAGFPNVNISDLTDINTKMKTCEELCDYLLNKKED